MATTTSTKGARFWNGVVSHRPLQKFFQWCFKGLAIIAVPAIILATIVIACELFGDPQWFTHGTGLLIATTADDLLNVAIEASMLGCLSIANQARRSGNTRLARWMISIAVFFAALTLTTVAFYKAHIGGAYDIALLLVRVGACLMFCILVHSMDNDEQEQEQQSAASTQLPDIMTRLQEIERNLAERLAQVERNATEAVERIERSLTERVALAEQSLDALSSIAATPTTQELEQIITREVRSVRVSLERQLPKLIETHTANALPAISAPTTVNVKRSISIVESAPAEQQSDVRSQIAALLAREPTLSSRRIAEIIGSISHTTAAAHKKAIMEEAS